MIQLPRHEIANCESPPPAPPCTDAAVEGLAEAAASLSYRIECVPSCCVTPDGIEGSVVYPVLKRSQWEALTSGMYIRQTKQLSNITLVVSFTFALLHKKISCETCAKSLAFFFSAAQSCWCCVMRRLSGVRARLAYADVC